jgi:hypothetical protein
MELGIRLDLARRKVPFSEDMLKKKLISPMQHAEVVMAVQLLEAQVRARLIETEDEIELLNVQREMRLAEHLMAKARLDRAKVEQSRLAGLEKEGTAYASKSELELADAELRLMEGHLLAREAGVKEVEIRTAQAKRRLDRLRAIPFPTGLEQTPVTPAPAQAPARRAP